MNKIYRKVLFSLVGGCTLIASLLPTITVQAYAIDRYGYNPSLQVPKVLPEKVNFSDPEMNTGNAYAGIKPDTQQTYFGWCTVDLATAFEQQVFELINQERQKAGVPLLSLKENLSVAAREHSADMSCSNYFSHSGSDGKTPFDRIKDQDYQYSAAGENIFAGEDAFFTPQQALNAWLSSPAHRATMLRDHYTEVGIGIVFNPDSQFGGYFTIDFASPAS